MGNSAKKALALLLAWLWVVGLVACGGETQTQNPGPDAESGQVQSPAPALPDFYRNLSTLLTNEKNSHYFGEISLTVGSDEMYIDGEKQIISSVPEYNESRLMLPVKAIAEAAGAKVSGNITASGITISSAYGDIIQCRSGSNTLSVNGAESLMDAAPYNKDGEPYMSANSIASALHLNWDWNQDTSTVTITAPYQTSRILVMAGDEFAEELKPNQRLGGLGAEEPYLNDGTGMWILQFASPEKAKAALDLLEVYGYQAEPDYFLAKDPLSASENIEINVSPRSWGYERCGYEAFMDAHPNPSASAVVAVVDSGVDVAHPFINGRVLNGLDIIDGDYTPEDGNSHGTHVAGTIIDCTRYADVRILPVRVLNNEGTGSTSTVVEGIKYAANNRADIINLSLGGRRNPDSNSAEESAINYAISKGSLVVIAAGNDNEDTSYFCPAYVKMPGAVVVAAGDKDYAKADFSNYGESVSLMAPGVGITSSIPGGEYEPKSGTSMAAPHVSAAAALLDLATGKTLSPAALESILLTATSNGYWTNPEMGYGFLDLSKAEVSSTNPSPGNGKAATTLMADHSTASDEDSAKTYPVFGSDYQRQQIISVTFLSDLSNANQDAWDVSEDKDGSVLAWVVSNSGGYDLYIAGNGGVNAPADCGYLFYGYSNLKEVNFNGAFHTDNVTDMSGMFYKCTSLAEVDLSGMNTVSVTNMAYMFCECESLVSVKLRGINTSKVTNMSNLFSNCLNLSDVDVSGFDTSGVNTMHAMFNRTLALRTLDVSDFQTSNVTNMGWMFNGCNAEKIEVGRFDTAKVTSMACMFSYTVVTDLDVSGFDTSNVTDMRSMFAVAENLRQLNVSGFDTSKVTDIRWMFYKCSSLQSVDISGFDLSNVVQDEDFMTDCPAQKPLTITPLRGTTGFEYEGFENLFDGDEGTKWCLPFPEDGPAYVEWKMSRPGMISNLYLSEGNDNSQFPGRNPGSWRLYGCNDEDIHHETGVWVWHGIAGTDETDFPDQDFLTYTYYLSGDRDSYQYYRLEIGSTTGADVLQLSEISIDYR